MFTFSLQLCKPLLLCRSCHICWQIPLEPILVCKGLKTHEDLFDQNYTVIGHKVNKGSSKGTYNNNIIIIQYFLHLTGQIAVLRMARAGAILLFFTFIFPSLAQATTTTSTKTPTTNNLTHVATSCYPDRCPGEFNFPNVIT